MCNGPDTLRRKPAMAAVDAKDDVGAKKESLGSVLLELAAADDVPGFRRAVEEGGLDVDQASPWYGRWGRRMGLEPRTPLMVAAMYGSTGVLGYILAGGAVDVNWSCGSDGATALHCAAAGGAPACAEAAKMLVAASANVDAVDAAGNRPGDLIPRKPAPGGSPKARPLELLLKGAAFGVAAAMTKEEASPAKQGEKKEYPADLTLPDIKNGVYSTDEFRMYAFKVRPCSRAYSHDWTECPFVHPGENARRRDPRKYHYSCVPCPEFRKGACRNGDACEYAHGVFESWLHPAQYRTRLCKDEIGCTRRVCFFAHKPEELRPPASPAGSVLPSPRSPALPPLDVAAAAAAASLMLNQPMSPTAASSAMAAASVWLNQAGGGVLTPTRQLPGSRLKTGLSARGADLDMDLLSLDGYQKQLLDELASLSSPKSWKSSLAATSCMSDYGDLLGSLESPSLLSQLQGLSLRQSAAAAVTGAAQFQSPAGIQMHQNMSQQLLSGYSSGNLPSSPSLRSSSPSSFGIDHSMAAATAIMNSRSSAFTKRSQSFCDRSASISRLSGLGAANTSVAAADLSNWGSPSGKLDWGIQGEELSKLRKSASFGLRSNGSGVTGAAAMAASPDEPDVSWVQSLVKDGPALPGHLGAEQLPKHHQGSAFGELRAQDMLSPWAEQLYMEPEQMVA